MNEPLTYEDGIRRLEEIAKFRYRDGIRRAEEIAVKTTDEFWNKEFAHHGNKGVAGFKCTVGHLIEEAIHKEWKDLK